MPDYERTVTVSADPQAAFSFLSDTANLPKYVATMALARPESGDRLRVAADVQGRHEEGEAMFRTDASARLIEWGGENGSGYSGRLQVVPSGAGSMVTVHLHLEHQEDETEINRVLDDTASNIQRLLGGST